MGTAPAMLVHALQRYQLLESDQLSELTREFMAGFPDPKALARELLRRGWLTAYQVNQLLQDQGRTLLLGSYILLERLGEGGMGQVFKARNWKLGQIVALKLIRPERVARPHAVRRFHREIRAVAQLNHPNIVRALDADEVGGTHLLVMEYAEGTDLARLVKQSGPLPVRKACDYIRQAALGLQHAYEQGLVHRDIKPSNLLLTAKGSVVKILDLGLARLEDGAEGETTSSMTQDGCVVGTADYMAPEQARDSHKADVRADLYSLGCSLYYLLTGQVPFPGGSGTEKLLQHLLDEPRPVERLRPEIPSVVAAVVRKLMAKRLEDRYQTPAETAAVLHSLLSAGRAPAPVTMKATVPPSVRAAAAQRATILPGSTPPAPARQRRPRFAALALLLVLGVIGVSWALLHRPSSPPATTALAQGNETSSRPTEKGKSNSPQERFDSRPREPAPVLGEQRGQSQGAVYALAISGDGRVLAGGGADQAIHLWETANWQERTVALRGHTGEIRALAFTADGKTLASGSSDQTIKLWDVVTGKELATLQGHTGGVWSLAFAPDGRTLASGADRDPQVRLWDVFGKKERATGKGHEGGVHAVAFASEDQTLASAGADRMLRLWDAGDMNKEPTPLKGHTSDVISLAYAPDGKKLASGTVKGVLRLWNPATKENRRLSSGAKAAITALTFSADSKRLVSADARGRLILWDADTSGQLQDWTFPSAVHSVAFSPKGLFVVAGTGAGTIHVVSPNPVAGKPSK